MSRARPKPLDVGNGLVAASVSTDGSLLAVVVPERETGLIELSAVPAFPRDRDGDGAAVRAHRRGLTDPAHAVLAVVDAAGEPFPDVVPGDPRWMLRGDGWGAELCVSAPAEGTTVRLVHRLTTTGPGRLLIRFRGRLGRPGYAEITPGGPVPEDLPASSIESDGRRLDVGVPTAPGSPVARVEVHSAPLRLGSWTADEDGAVLEVGWPGSVEGAELTVSVTMPPGTSTPNRPRPTVVGGPDPDGRAGDDVLDLVESGALRYTVGCTALEVAPDQCCIVTDHRLLPLSWTRDAYYQAALLLARGADLPGAVDVVERHLAWLWDSSRDRDGTWRRSHLTDGAVKDTGYQVDQQLFPLLELADFRRTTGRWPRGGGDGWGRRVREVWRGLPREHGGLVPGEENPADDPASLPYLLSSQLLLVYTARRLAEHENELEIESLGLGADAERTLAIVRSTYACPGPFGEMWAYETDARGTHRRYQDANDVPTALAPMWGLCAPDDPVWQATMAFAFSDHNPGYVPGAHAGLGSAHTPGVWPLGDAQEWAFAEAVGDDGRRQRVMQRVSMVAGADGMLPETYDPDTGAWVARHWFAWPGSLLGTLNAAFRRHQGPWVPA